MKISEGGAAGWQAPVLLSISSGSEAQSNPGSGNSGGSGASSGSQAGTKPASVVECTDASVGEGCNFNGDIDGTITVGPS